MEGLVGGEEKDNRTAPQGLEAADLETRLLTLEFFKYLHGLFGRNFPYGLH